MVTQFGMSQVVGPITVSEYPELALVGHEVVQRQAISQHIAELVDREVRRIVQEAYARASDLLRTNRATLDALASALLECETLERAEIAAIVGSTQTPLPVDLSSASPVRQHHSGTTTPSR
jgi:cell division protease FtsH